MQGIDQYPAYSCHYFLYITSPSYYQFITFSFSNTMAWWNANYLFGDYSNDSSNVPDSYAGYGRQDKKENEVVSSVHPHDKPPLLPDLNKDPVYGGESSYVHESVTGYGYGGEHSYVQENNTGYEYGREFSYVHDSSTGYEYDGEPSCVQESNTEYVDKEEDDAEYAYPKVSYETEQVRTGI